MTIGGEPSRDFNPRHRIIGAVILVVIAVILLPLILRENPPTQTDPAPQQIPLPPRDQFISSVPPPPATQPPEPAAPPAPAAAPPAASPASPPAPPATKPSQAAAPPGAPAAARKQPVAPAGGKGWVVQIGAFSRADNAHKLRDKLRQQKLPAEAEPIKVDKGTMVRVWVGPFRDKAEAKAMQARLQSEHNLKGVVVAHPSRYAVTKPAP